MISWIAAGRGQLQPRFANDGDTSAWLLRDGGHGAMVMLGANDIDGRANGLIAAWPLPLSDGRNAWLPPRSETALDQILHDATIFALFLLWRRLEGY